MRLSAKMQLDFPYLVKTSSLELQDLYIDLDDVTLLEDDTIFKLDAFTPRPDERKKDLVIQISFEMDYALTEI